MRFLPLLSVALVIPATAGEFWMIIYLLVWGVRRTPVVSPAGDEVAAG